MGGAAFQLERHAEPGGVELAVVAAALGQLGDRGVRDQGEVIDVAPVAGLVAPGQAERLAGERRQRLGPRAGDHVRADRPAVEIGDQAVGERGGVAFGDAAIRERQRQVLSLGVVRRADGLQRTEIGAGEEPSVLVHQVEEPVLGDPHVDQLDVLRVRECQ